MAITTTVGKGIAWNTVSTVVGKVVMLANIFIALSFLTLHEYGLTQLVLSAIAIAGILQLPGLADAVVADLVIERKEKRYGRMKEILMQYLGLLVVLAIAAWAILFFAANLVVSLEGGVLASYYVQIASFMLLASPIRVFSTTVMTVSLRFKEIAFYSIIEELAKLAGLIVFVVWLDRGPEGLLIATTLSQFIPALLFLPFVLSCIRPVLAARAEEAAHIWKSIYRHRLWSIMTSYMNTLNANAQVWVVKLFAGTEAVALYSVAQGLAAHIVSFLPLTSIVGPIIPRYVGNAPAFKRLLRTSFKVQALSAVALMAGGAVGVPILVHVAFPQYVAALPIFFVLLLALLPNSMSVVLTPAFAAFKHQRALFMSSTFKALTTLVTLVAGTAFFGLIGAGAASAVTAFLSALERQWRFRRMEPEYSPGFRRFLSIDREEREELRNLWTRIRARYIRV